MIIVWEKCKRCRWGLIEIKGKIVLCPYCDKGLVKVKETK